MTEGVASNFQALWSYVQDPSASSGLSTEMKEMLKKFSRDAFSVSLIINAQKPYFFNNSKVPHNNWSYNKTVSILQLPF